MRPFLYRKFLWNSLYKKASKLAKIMPSYFGMIYNREILVYNVLEIKNMQKRRKQREGRGQMMDIKLPTVKTHVSHILTKLGGGKPQKRGENRGKEA